MGNDNSCHLLLCFLQLSVQPTVLLFLNQQSDDVAIVKAEECGIGASHVGKDGLDARPFAQVETWRLRHRVGQGEFADAAVVWWQIWDQRDKTHIWSRSSVSNNIERTRGTHLCFKSHWCVAFQPPVPELRSVEVVSGDLGSGLNMLASGLICAFRGGAGGGTRESWFFWLNEVHDEQTKTHVSAWVTRLFGLTGSSDSYVWFTKTQAWPRTLQLVRSTRLHRQC